MANYKVPKGEEGLYHVSFYTGARFDPDTGKEVGNIQTLKINPNQYKMWADEAPRHGIKVVEVLHDPTAKAKRKPAAKAAPQGDEA